MTNNANIRRVIAIFENSMKEYTQQKVTDLLNHNLLNPSDYENEESDIWYDLHERVFDNEYTGRNIFPTPDLLIRCLNFIRETEMDNYGNVMSFQDISDVYSVENIFRTTAYYLVDYEMNSQFIYWVKECFQAVSEVATAVGCDDEEILEIIDESENRAMNTEINRYLE
jgi:hypothetical protein